MTNDPIVQKAARATRMSMANTSFRKRRPRSKRASPTDPFYQENRSIEITIFPVQIAKMIDSRWFFAGFVQGLRGESAGFVQGCRICPKKGTSRSLSKVFPAGA
ncbi:MAG: hypothetical protein RRZ85_11080 [Gordonibacter sp.]|uniref:hypothetical protein n=1 Tax=Gordonibacter sp. TaxID=1968902 RepID=UPI002FC633C4